MRDIAFQVWSADGKPMVNLRMNTMRLVARLSVGPMDADTKTVYHPACRVATTKAFVIPTFGGFASISWGLGPGYYNMRPRIEVFDGYFRLHIQPGTATWMAQYANPGVASGPLDVLLFTTE